MTDNEKVKRLREALSRATFFLEGYVGAAATLTSKWKAAEQGIKNLEKVLEETK